MSALCIGINWCGVSLDSSNLGVTRWAAPLAGSFKRQLDKIPQPAHLSLAHRLQPCVKLGSQARQRVRAAQLRS